MTSALRVAVVQMAHLSTLDDALAAARAHAKDAAARGAAIVLLPEYFFAAIPPLKDGPLDLEGTAARVRVALAQASRESGAAVAGNAIEPIGGALRNVLCVFDEGALVAEQLKIHPMPREAESGIVGGDLLEPFALRGATAGGIVCADIFYPEASRVLSLKGAEILLNPVMSPYRTPDPTKDARESVYVARAWDSGAFVLKAGGFSRPEKRIVGRSLVAAPWGLVARYHDEFAEEIVVADLDLDALRAFREQHRGFQARVPKAYRSLFDG